MSNSDPFLCKDTLIATSEAQSFDIISQQSKDDVVTSWTLSTVETYTNSNLSGWLVFAFSESDNLMAFF